MARGRNRQIRTLLENNTADFALLTNSELVEKYHVSLKTISRFRSKIRVPSPVLPRNRQIRVLDLAPQIIALRDKNVSYADIAETLGISKSSIRKALIVNGRIKKHSTIYDEPITPENCIPALYEGLPEPQFDFEKITSETNPNYGRECRARYYQLRQWKLNKAKRLSKQNKQLKQDKQEK